MLSKLTDKILVADDDPEALDLIAQQVLIPQGYQVQTATDGNTALQMALKLQPEVIITSLTLPGLSGRDFLAAIRAQKLNCTIIATGPKGDETKALQAFRLGAKDYLTKPIREAELVNIVDHALEDVRLRRDREQLAQRLKTTNDQLEKRVKELTTLYGIGKTVTAITNLAQLFNRLVEGGLFVTEGELGWLSLVDEATGQMVLRANKNFPQLGPRLNQPWDDGVSALLMQSGEGITLAGPPLAKLPIGQIAKAAVVVPIKVKDQAIGVLGVGNLTGKKFTDHDQAMLSAVADYASIALVNTRLLQAMEAKARSLQQAYDELTKGAKTKDDTLGQIARELRLPLTQARSGVEAVIRDGANQLGNVLMGPLRASQERLDALQRLADDLTLLGESGPRAPSLRPTNLTDLAKQAAGRIAVEARQAGISVNTDLAGGPFQVAADATLITRALDNLLLHALKVAPQGSVVVVRVKLDEGGLVQVAVTDQGPTLSPDKLNRIWERFLSLDSPTSRKGLNTGLSLAAVKQIVDMHGGKVLAESEPGKGTTLAFAIRKL